MKSMECTDGGHWSSSTSEAFPNGILSFVFLRGNKLTSPNTTCLTVRMSGGHCFSLDAHVSTVAPFLDLLASVEIEGTHLLRPSMK